MNATLISRSILIRNIKFGFEGLPLSLSDSSLGNSLFNSVSHDCFLDLSQRKFQSFWSKIRGILI